MNAQNSPHRLDNEHSIRVLEHLSEEPVVSQRELSEKIGLSVGLINLTINRLVSTGYIKVTNISHKRAAYYLTPRGVQELMRRSYDYLHKTVFTYQQFITRAMRLLEKHIANGKRKFVVVGKGEIANLVIQCFEKLKPTNAIEWRHVEDTPLSNGNMDEIILDARLIGGEGTSGISLLSELMDGKVKEVVR